MKISLTVRKMIMVMLVSALVMVICGTIASFYFEVLRPVPFAFGVLLTTGLNIIKTVWLERSIDRAMAIGDDTAATNHIRIHALLRFALTGLVLALAVFVPFIDLWGAVAGIFTYHPAKYALYFITKSDNSDTL